MTIVDDIYDQKCSDPSDINELLPTLKKYASQCEHITEMGVRGIVSTWAFLAGRPKFLISYDIRNPADWGGKVEEVRLAGEEIGTVFEFHLKDVLQIEIDETDLLFIDTKHTTEQMEQELKLHANKVRKYLIFHDTTLNAFRDEGTQTEGRGGIWPPIEQFLKDNSNWSILEKIEYNNGLTVLVRNDP